MSNIDLKDQLAKQIRLIIYFFQLGNIWGLS